MKTHLFASSLCAVLSLGAAAEALAADVEYGKVISKTPVYVQVSVPERQCVAPVGFDVQNCQTVTRTENRFVAFDVTYEYKGQRYTSRVLHDPGERMALSVTVTPIGSVDEQRVDTPATVATTTLTAPPAVVYASPTVVYAGPPVVYGPPAYWGPRISLGFGWGWGGGYRRWR